MHVWHTHIHFFFTDENNLHMVSRDMIHIDEHIGISECSKTWKRLISTDATYK